MTPPVWQVARRIEKAEERPPAQAPAPGEAEAPTILVLPLKEVDSPKPGARLAPLLEIMEDAEKRGGVSLSRLLGYAAEGKALSYSLRRIWRAGGQAGTERFLALISPYREAVEQARREFLKRECKHRRLARRWREKVPILVPEVVDVPALPAGPRLLLPPAPPGTEEEQRNSVEQPLPPGWHMVKPRPQIRPWLDRTAGRPIKVRFPGYPTQGWED